MPHRGVAYAPCKRCSDMAHGMARPVHPQDHEQWPEGVLARHMVFYGSIRLRR